MNCYQDLYNRPHVVILQPHLLTFSIYHNLGFIHIDSHAFTLHIIFPLIKSFNHKITYSFIANCQTEVVHKNKTKRRSNIYKSQYIILYNILTVKLQSVIREMRSGSCLLWGLFLRLWFCAVGGGKSVRRIWFGQVKILLNSFSSEEM